MPRKRTRTTMETLLTRRPITLRVTSRRRRPSLSSHREVLAPSSQPRSTRLKLRETESSVRSPETSVRRRSRS